MIQFTDKEELHRSCPSPLFKLPPTPTHHPLLPHQRPTLLPDTAGPLRLQSHGALPKQWGHRETNAQAPSTEKHTQNRGKSLSWLPRLSERHGFNRPVRVYPDSLEGTSHR